MEGFEALYSDRRLNPTMAQAAINSWSLLLTIAPPVLIRQLVERYLCDTTCTLPLLCCYAILFYSVDNFLYYKLSWDQMLLALKLQQGRQLFCCLN